MGDYEYVKRVPIRYRDIDTQLIVNNGVYPTYLTECRAGYLEDVVGLVVEEIQDIVTARLEVDYLAPVKRGEELQVHLRCSEVGATSFTLEYEIRADGTATARARSVHVTIDPETGESKPVPDDYRVALKG